MAKILDETALGARPAPQPTAGFSQYRVDPTALLEPGRALMRTGAGLEAEGDKLFNEFKVEQEKADNVRVQDAINKLKERKLDLEIGEKDGYMRLKGGAAVNQPLLPQYTQKYDDAYQQIAGSLASDAQREKFKLHAAPVEMQLKEGLLRHMVTQGDVYAKEVYEGTVRTSVRDAVVQWNNPLAVELAVAGISNAVNNRAERESWPKEMRDAEFQLQAGKVHNAVVQQALATGNPAYAEKWYEAHKADIDLPTAKALEVSVRDGEQKQLSNGYRAEFLAVQQNPKALNALKDKVLGDPTLNDDRRNALVGPIQNQIMTLDRRAEAARERWERRTERTINSFNADTLAGYPGTDPQRGLDMVNATKGTPLEPMARDAFNLANATRNFAKQPPTVQAQMLQQAEAQVRQDPTKVDRKIVDAWRQIQGRQQEEVKQDPTGFAARQGLVDLQPVDLTKPEASATALAQRYDVARAVSAQYAVPVKPLQPEEVAVVSRGLSEGSPEQQAAYLGRLKQGWGGNNQGFMATMQQIAPDNPVAAVAGSHAALDRWDAASMILRGNSYLHPNKKTDGSPAKTDLVEMPPPALFEQKFKDTVGDAFAGKADQRSAALQAVRAAYATMAVDNPKDADTKSVNSDFFDKALKTVIGGVDSYRGKTVVLPYGYDGSMFRDGVKRLVDQAYDQGVKTEFTKDRLLDLPLVNRGDGRYVFMAGDSIVLDKSGRPIQLDFNQGLPFRPSGMGRDSASATRPADITDLSRRTATQR